MGNCIKIYLYNRLYAVVQWEATADFLVRTLCEGNKNLSTKDFRTEVAFVEGVGF